MTVPVVASVRNTSDTDIKVLFKVGERKGRVRYGEHFYIDLYPILLSLGHNKNFFLGFIRVVETIPNMGVIIYSLATPFGGNNTLYVIKFKVTRKSSGTYTYNGRAYQKYNFQYILESLDISNEAIYGIVPSSKTINSEFPPEISEYGTVIYGPVYNTWDCPGYGKVWDHHWFEYTSSGTSGPKRIDRGFELTETITTYVHQVGGGTTSFDDVLTYTFDNEMIRPSGDGWVGMDDPLNRPIYPIGMSVECVDRNLINLHYTLCMTVDLTAIFRVDGKTTWTNSVPTYTCSHGTGVNLFPGIGSSEPYGYTEIRSTGTPCSVKYEILLICKDGSLSYKDYAGSLGKEWYYSYHPTTYWFDPIWPITMTGLQTSEPRMYYWEVFTYGGETLLFSNPLPYIYPFERPGSYREMYPIRNVVTGMVSDTFVEYVNTVFGDFTTNRWGVWLPELGWEGATVKNSLIHMGDGIKMPLDIYDVIYPGYHGNFENIYKRASAPFIVGGESFINNSLGGGVTERHQGYFSTHGRDIYIVGGTIYTDDMPFPSNAASYYGRSSRELIYAKTKNKLIYYPVIQTNYKMKGFDEMTLDGDPGANDVGVLRGFFPQQVVITTYY
jgi:hypothetical protein